MASTATEVLKSEDAEAAPEADAEAASASAEAARTPG